VERRYYKVKVKYLLKKKLIENIKNTFQFFKKDDIILFPLMLYHKIKQKRAAIRAALFCFSFS